MGDKGGLKFDEEKCRVDLLPSDALWEIAKVLTFGARKYSAWNWYEGISYSRLFGACLRHLYQWWRGHDNDSESSINHLAHAGCCLLFMLQFALEGRKENDDRPTWRGTLPECGVTADGKTSSVGSDTGERLDHMVVIPTDFTEGLPK